MRSPDAVGINGLSSGVTTSGYFEPGSSSEPPRPTSRRSAFEEERERLAFEAATEHSASEEESEHSALEEELNHSAMEEEKRKDLALEEDRDRSPFEASQRSADEEMSQQPAFDEERKNLAFGAFAEERKNRESIDSPPEELHKIIQVNDPAHEQGDKPSPKVYLQFSALTYTVCKKPSRWQRLKGMVLPGLKATRPPLKQLRLLDGISGEARDGEILAVMGPSGSGKSTLIDALAQRIDAVKGTMTLNGNYFSERLLRNISAYVMQDDLLYPMLTVRETLLFSAFFRLPPSQSKATKVARVNNLLDQLGLVRVANTIIGDEGHRGVSGGERRRVSIGIDIIHDPLILFLDEPTSGLDSTSAYLVVRTLQKIAQTGSLVILSIHQPSYRIMGLFDHLIILAFGEKVYGGRPLDLNLFFEEFGRPVPKHENSTEHALDLIQELHASQEGIAPLVEFCRAWEARSQPSMPMQAMQNFPDANAAMSSVLQNEKLLASKGSSPKMENSSGSTSGWLHHMHAKSDAETVCTFANPWWAEVVVLVRRSWKNIQRTPELFLMRLVTVLVTGFILATIFWHLDATPLGVQERLGFFAFAMSTTYYTCADALPVFLQERYIFMRETTTNAYRKSSYVLAHAIIYVPFLAILSMGYCIIIWWAVGLAGGGSGFLFLFLIVWASFWAGNSFVTLLSAIMPNVMVGYTITVAMLAYFLLLSGFFISRLRIPWYWRWFHYISIIKYPYEAVLLNEFGKTKSCFEIGRQLFHGTPLANLNDQIIDGILGYIRSLPALRKTPYAQIDSTSCILTGHDILINKEIVELNKWKCLGITVAFGIVFRYAFYIVIRITGKNKRD
ncbi:hypothetical protein KC19_3G070400 [Ceratodon purpureus]|nr:hypothetical protein KC19_3G070400 [Ceratodon purpureus]